MYRTKSVQWNKYLDLKRKKDGPGFGDLGQRVLISFGNIWTMVQS